MDLGFLEGTYLLARLLLCQPLRPSIQYLPVGGLFNRDAHTGHTDDVLDVAPLPTVE
jgi:hypothetical protein